MPNGGEAAGAESRARRFLSVGIDVGVLLLALLSVALFLTGTLRRTTPGFPWDDAWTHATLARNLAETGRIGLNPGQSSGGSSSLLWVFLLAGGYLLGLNPWTVTITLGAGAHLFSTWIFSHLAEGLTGKVGGALAGATYALFGPLVFLSLSGMETGLFLALGMATVWAWTRQRSVWVGTLLGLLLLLRIEALALWGLLLVTEAVAYHRERTLAPLACLVLLPLGALILGSGIRFLSEGGMLPLTMSGRRWLWDLSTPGSWVWEEKYFFLQVWRILLFDWFLQALRLEHWPALHGSYLVLFSGWMLGGAAFLGWRTWTQGWDRRHWGGVLLLLWGMAHMLTYFLLLPVSSIRHQVVFLPGFLLILVSAEGLLFTGLHRSTRWRKTRLPWLGRGLVSMLLLGWAAVTCQQWQSNYYGQVNHINQIHVRAGHWITQNLPADAVVAAFDIGAVSYFGQRELVDLGGLTDEAILPSLYAGEVTPYLQAQGVTHLVMVGHPGEHWWERLGLVAPTIGTVLTLDLLQEYEVPRYVRPPFDRPADYYFYPAYRYMAIYAIHWSASPPEQVRTPNILPTDVSEEVGQCYEDRFLTTYARQGP